MGYLKNHLSGEDKQELLGLIRDYQQGLLPLIVPLTLLKHHLNPYPVPKWVPVPFGYTSRSTSIRTRSSCCAITCRYQEAQLVLVLPSHRSEGRDRGSLLDPISPPQAHLYQPHASHSSPRRLALNPKCAYNGYDKGRRRKPL
jgi:hypothetical protein